MSDLAAALEPTHAEACLEVAIGLNRIITSANARDQCMIQYDTTYSYFYLVASDATTWQINIHYRTVAEAAGTPPISPGYITSIVPLGSARPAITSTFATADDAAGFINSCTLGIAVAPASSSMDESA
jgi:hypothetical protein